MYIKNISNVLLDTNFIEIMCYKKEILLNEKKGGHFDAHNEEL